MQQDKVVSQITISQQPTNSKENLIKEWARKVGFSSKDFQKKARLPLSKLALSWIWIITSRVCPTSMLNRVALYILTLVKLKTL